MSTIYMPVIGRAGLDSAQRAAGISTELYNLILPKRMQEPGRTTTMLLGIIVHPVTGQSAIVGDTTLAIEVNPQRDMTALISLFPELEVDERAALTYYVATNDVVYFQYLIPPDADILTQEEAEAAGWFPAEI